VGHFKSFAMIDTGITSPTFGKFSREDPKWSSGKWI